MLETVLNWLGDAVGIGIQAGPWLMLLVAALYLRRARLVADVLTRAVSIAVAVFLVIALGLFTGIIPGINVGRLVALLGDIGEAVDVLWRVASEATGGGR